MSMELASQKLQKQKWKIEKPGGGTLQESQRRFERAIDLSSTRTLEQLLMSFPHIEGRELIFRRDTQHTQPEAERV